MSFGQKQKSIANVHMVAAAMAVVTGRASGTEQTQGSTFHLLCHLLCWCCEFAAGYFAIVCVFVCFFDQIPNFNTPFQSFQNVVVFILDV